MSTEPRVVPLDEVPDEEVLALVRLGLGTGSVPRTAELWRWKHREGPFGPSPGLVAMDGGRAVALRVFSRWRFRGPDGVETSAVRAVDTATHPEWRRRGLFRRLTRELVERLAADGVSFVFNTPNRVSYRGYRRLGWEPAGRVPLAVRQLRLLRGSAPAAAVDAALGELGRPVADLLSEPRLAAFLDRLWQDERRLHTPRDAAYLTWRYARVPGIGYRAVWDLSDATSAVVLARPRRRRGRAEVALAEVMVAGGEAGVLRASGLIREVTAAAAAAGAAHLIAVPPARSAERRALVRAGFVVVPAVGPRLAVRRLAAAPPSHVGRWRWSLGDLELF